MAKKEIKESEIEILKRKFEELGKEIDKYVSKEVEKIEEGVEKIEEPIVKKSNRKYVWILVCLIIIILVVDIIALVAYYKPDFSSLIKFGISKSNNSISNVSGKCFDGTPEAACSENKPLFCYGGQLLKNARICGCPAGYKQDFQDCVEV